MDHFFEIIKRESGHGYLIGFWEINFFIGELMSLESSDGAGHNLEPIFEFVSIEIEESAAEGEMVGWDMSEKLFIGFVPVGGED